MSFFLKKLKKKSFKSNKVESYWFNLDWIKDWPSSKTLLNVLAYLKQENTTDFEKNS